jgi:hypothetical protein
MLSPFGSRLENDSRLELATTPATTYFKEKATQHNRLLITD